MLLFSGFRRRDQGTRPLGRSDRDAWSLGRSSREGEAAPILGLPFSAVLFSSMSARFEMVAESEAADIQS